MSSSIIIALDFKQRVELDALVAQLDPNTCRLKVGKEAFVRFGPALVQDLVRQNFDVFLDLKFHDIPNTVANACAAAADLGVWMVNVHASGGAEMMSAARKTLEADDAPLLIAVTVLTSMAEADLLGVNVVKSPADQVLSLAKLANKSGLDGVVCSAQEAKTIKQSIHKDFLTVTPGIRLTASEDDQKRVMTPLAAKENGADYLVIGRPVTKSDDPVGKILTINSELNE